MKRKANGYERTPTARLWPPGALNLNAEWTLTAAMFKADTIKVKYEAQPAAKPSKAQALITVRGAAIDNVKHEAKHAAKPSKALIPAAVKSEAINVKHGAKPGAEMFPAGTLNHRPWSTHTLSMYGDILANSNYYPGAKFAKLNQARLMINIAD